MIQKKILFLIIFSISVLVILITRLPLNINAQTLHNLTLEEKAKEIGTQDFPQINVGELPTHIKILDNFILKGKVYVVNTGSDTISVISTKDNTKIKDIPVGKNPVSIGIAFNNLYVVNTGSDTISVIDTESDTKIKEITGLAFRNNGYITLSPSFDKLYVANDDSDIISVISTKDNTKIKDIFVGKFPVSIGIHHDTHQLYVALTGSTNSILVIDTASDTLKTQTQIENIRVSDSDYTTITGELNKLYVANSDSFFVSVISPENNRKIKDIPVGKNPTSIGIHYNTNTLYVANTGSDTISVIDKAIDRKIKDIPVGKNPTSIDISQNTNTLYVVNTGSDTISVISTKNNTKIKDIPVGKNPTSIGIHYNTNTLYVANTGSNGISVIDGVTNKVVAGMRFNITPPNSGYIKCNDINFPLNQFFYVSSECKAKPNKGFEFISWIENLENNSNRTIKTSAEDNYILDSFYDIFGYKPDDPAASLFQFGNYTANFKALPPPIPSEYLIPLYGIIITTIIGWSIPSIINYIRTKNDIRKLSHYHKKIISLYNDGKLDEKDIDHLNGLKKSISDDYSKGKINERHYESLEKEISISYEEIFMKRINSIINNSSSANKEDKKKQLVKINEDIEDAYSKSRINELHYTLLKEKVDSLKTIINSPKNHIQKRSPI